MGGECDVEGWVAEGFEGYGEGAFGAGVELDFLCEGPWHLGEDVL